MTSEKSNWPISVVADIRRVLTAQEIARFDQLLDILEDSDVENWLSKNEAPGFGYPSKLIDEVREIVDIALAAERKDDGTTDESFSTMTWQEIMAREIEATMVQRVGKAWAGHWVPSILAREIASNVFSELVNNHMRIVPTSVVTISKDIAQIALQACANDTKRLAALNEPFEHLQQISAYSIAANSLSRTEW